MNTRLSMHTTFQWTFAAIAVAVITIFIGWILLYPLKVNKNNLQKISAAKLTDQEQSMRYNSSLQPNSFSLIISLARNLKYQHKYDEAQAILTNSIEAVSTIGRSFLFLEKASLYHWSGDIKYVLPTLLKARSADPDNGKVLIVLARYYTDQKLYKESLEALQQAEGVGSQKDIILFEQGRVYQNQQSFDQATEAYKRALDLNPSIDWLYFRLGTFYTETGWDDISELFYKKSINRNTSAVWAYQGLMQLYAREGKVSETDQIQKRIAAIRINPTLFTQRSSSAKIASGIIKTGINWIVTNRKGMTFGILFGGAFMAFLLRLSTYRAIFQLKGWKGALTGLFMGTPLGVCANCVTPIGLALYKQGVSPEILLSAMVASPSLNIIGLIIIFSIFPLPMALIRLGATLLLMLVVIPLLVKFFYRKPHTVTTKTLTSPIITTQTEPWSDAVISAIKEILLQTWHLIRLTVPLMIVAGALGATLITVFPIENLLLSHSNQFIVILSASLLGAILPIPMFVDIILVLALFQAGIGVGPAAALLITLPSASIYSSFIIGKYISWKLSIALLFITILMGVTGGILATLF